MAYSHARGVTDAAGRRNEKHNAQRKTAAVRRRDRLEQLFLLYFFFLGNWTETIGSRSLKQRTDFGSCEKRPKDAARRKTKETSPGHLHMLIIRTTHRRVIMLLLYLYIILYYINTGTPLRLWGECNRGPAATQYNNIYMRTVKTLLSLGIRFDLQHTYAIYLL